MPGRRPVDALRLKAAVIDAGFYTRLAQPLVLQTGVPLAPLRDLALLHVVQFAGFLGEAIRRQPPRGQQDVGVMVAVVALLAGGVDGDVRRKILVGAAILAKVERGEWPESRLLELMDKELTRAHDRELFGLQDLGGAAPNAPALAREASGAESSPQAAAGRTNPLTASPGKFRLLAVDKRNGEGVKPRLGRPPKAADGA